jgi:hypothetical protein
MPNHHGAAVEDLQAGIWDLPAVRLMKMPEGLAPGYLHLLQELNNFRDGQVLLWVLCHEDIRGLFGNVAGVN